MRGLLLGVFLAGCAWSDGRRREISLPWLLLWAAIGCPFFFSGMWKKGGGLTGIFLLVAGVISKGQIGLGDGLVFLVSGLFLDAWENCLLLLGGLLLLAGRLLLDFFQRGKDIHKELPLLPYVFVAYLGGVLWRI